MKIRKSTIDLKVYIKKIPYLSKIKKIAKEEGVEVYLVGGFLRDIYLGCPFDKYDFDFTLNKKVLLFAKRFALEADGTFIMLDKINRTARVSVKHKGRLIDFDFNKLRAASLEEDLCMRDFTINSLAVDVMDKACICLDFNGALSDIKSKTLRTSVDKNIVDDPLRIMRGYRIAAMHGLTIVAELEKSMCKQARLLKQVSFERISEEIFRIFKCKNSHEYIRAMDDNKILEVIIPEIKRMRGVQQGDYHHLDVWDHSLETLRCYEKMYLKKLIKNQELIDDLSLEVAQGRTKNQLLKLACLLHDIGKPKAKGIKQGRIIFYEHAQIGSDITEKISKRFRLSKKETVFLKLLVKMHLRPGYLADIKEPSQKAIVKFFRSSFGEAPSMSILALSDWHATCGKAIDLELRKSHEKIMLSLVDEFFVKRNEKPIKKLLNGVEIMKMLKIKPSLKVGEIIGALEEAQALGEIKTKQQAKLFVKTYKC